MSLVEHYLPIRAALDQRKTDPLRYWRFAVDRVRNAVAMCSEPDPIDELHLRACNKGGKTSTVAAVMLACMQKREHLDGVPLPTWHGPLENAQLVLDYKQQLLSVQPAYLRLLGSWPHHARYTGEILSSLSVKPVGASDDENEWSVLHFLSQENKRTGVGVRGDVIAFDEPPVIDILRELRKAAHAGRRSLILIGETPTVRREWWPLREDYGETPRRSIRRVDRERAEVRWSLDEVADWVLSPEEKAKLRRKYKTDPLRDAREHGDYINAVGECPFDAEMLLQLLEECRDPEIVEWRVSIESLAGGRANQVARVPVEVFGAPKAGAEYYGCIDPASGVDDHKHNPAGLHLREVGSGDLVVRWNGYLAPYSVGVLGAGLGRQYHDARFDVEMKDHWGVNVVRGFTASRYGRLCHEERELRPGEWAKEVGWDANDETTRANIGCVQEWLEARRAGVRYAACPSRKVIECLLDCQLDDRDKIVAGATGTDHGEDLRLWGQGLRKAVSRANKAIPEVHRPKLTAEERLIREIRGEAVEDDEAPFDQVPVRARARPGW